MTTEELEILKDNIRTIREEILEKVDDLKYVHKDILNNSVYNIINLLYKIMAYLPDEIQFSYIRYNTKLAIGIISSCMKKQYKTYNTTFCQNVEYAIEKIYYLENYICLNDEQKQN